MKRHNEQQMTCREAVLTPGSVNEDGYSVEAVVATDRAVTVFDRANYRIIDEILVARGGEFPNDVPLLDSHNQSGCTGVFGSATQFRQDGSQWIGRAVFDSEDDDALKVFRKVKKGFIKSVSIGYRVSEAVEIRPGESARVDGKEYTANTRVLRIAKRWQVFELSVTPIGADEAAKFRDGVQVLKGLEVSRMNKRLLAYLRRLGLADGATDEQAREYASQLQGMERTIANVLDYTETDEKARTTADQMIRSAGFDPEKPWNTLPVQAERKVVGNDGASAVPTNTVVNPMSYEDGQRAERERIESIRAIAEAGNINAELVERAISEGWDCGRLGREAATILRNSRREPVSHESGPPAIHSRSHESTVTRLSLLSSLMEREGRNVAEHFIEYGANGFLSRRANPNDDNLQRAAENAHSFRGMSLIDIAREACRIDGIQVGRSDADVMSRAFSSGTLQYIFTQNFSAQLIAGYEAASDTTGPFTSDAQLPDFKTAERPRMKKGDKLTKLARGGEAQHVTREDIMESYKLARYAGQFQLDEQDMIDDRFGGLDTTPMELGEAARELRPDLVYAVIMANAAMVSDSTALFHANHGNLATSTAFSAANLKASITALNKQTENGRILNKSGPLIFVGPEALYWDADRAINSPALAEDSAAGTRNSLRTQAFTIVTDARLDLGVTDPSSGTTHAGSATTWYLMRSGRHLIEVGTLRGSSGMPSVRPFTLDKGRWGMGWDIKMDIGAKALDWLGMRKHTA